MPAPWAIKRLLTWLDHHQLFTRATLISIHPQVNSIQFNHNVDDHFSLDYASESNAIVSLSVSLLCKYLPMQHDRHFIINIYHSQV